MSTKPTINKLTIKQENFAQAYVKLGLHDGCNAYKEAGYSVKNKKETTIYQEVNRLLKNPKVALRISQLQAKVAEIADKKFNINAETILRHLDILRNARIDEYINFIYEKVATGEDDENGNPIFKEVPRMIFKPFDELTQEQLMCIESVKQNRYGEVELKLHGKEWTIEKINKHIGFYEKDNSQKSTTVLLEDENAVKERVNALMAKMNK